MLRNNLMDVTKQFSSWSFLAEITKRSRDENPYHNSIHGADVCQSLNSIMNKGKPFMKRLSHPVRYDALIAALCHDVGHVGRNNAVSCETSALGQPLLVRGVRARISFLLHLLRVLMFDAKCKKNSHPYHLSYLSLAIIPLECYRNT